MYLNSDFNRRGLDRREDNRGINSRQAYREEDNRDFNVRPGNREENRRRHESAKDSVKLQVTITEEEYRNCGGIMDSDDEDKVHMTLIKESDEVLEERRLNMNSVDFDKRKVDDKICEATRTIRKTDHISEIGGKANLASSEIDRHPIPKWKSNVDQGESMNHRGNNSNRRFENDYGNQYYRNDGDRRRHHQGHHHEHNYG